MVKLNMQFTLEFYFQEEWQYMNYPAHILVIPDQDGKSDFDNVMEKMDLIRKII